MEIPKHWPVWITPELIRGCFDLLTDADITGLLKKNKDYTAFLSAAGKASSTLSRNKGKKLRLKLERSL